MKEGKTGVNERLWSEGGTPAFSKPHQSYNKTVDWLRGTSGLPRRLHLLRMASLVYSRFPQTTSLPPLLFTLRELSLGKRMLNEAATPPCKLSVTLLFSLFLSFLFLTTQKNNLA